MGIHFEAYHEIVRQQSKDAIIGAWYAAYFSKVKKFPRLQLVMSQLKDKKDIPDEAILKKQHKEIVQYMKDNSKDGKKSR